MSTSCVSIIIPCKQRPAWDADTEEMVSATKKDSLVSLVSSSSETIVGPPLSLASHDHEYKHWGDSRHQHFGQIGQLCLTRSVNGTTMLSRHTEPFDVSQVLSQEVSAIARDDIHQILEACTQTFGSWGQPWGKWPCLES